MRIEEAHVGLKIIDAWWPDVVGVVKSTHYEDGVVVKAYVDFSNGDTHTFDHRDAEYMIPVKEPA